MLIMPLRANRIKMKNFQIHMLHTLNSMKVNLLIYELQDFWNFNFIIIDQGRASHNTAFVEIELEIEIEKKKHRFVYQSSFVLFFLKKKVKYTKILAT